MINKWRFLFLFLYCMMSYIQLNVASNDNLFLENLHYILIPIKHINYFLAYKFVLSFYGLICLLLLYVVKSDHSKTISYKFSLQKLFIE